MHILMKYCKDTGKRQRETARLFGISAPYLNQIIHGIRNPSPRLAIRIEKATDGRVSRKELLPDIWE